MYNITLRHVGCAKVRSITYSESMSVSIVIQHAEHMLCIILSSIACLALSYFSKLSHNFMILWKKFIECKMYVLFFSLQILLEIFLILKKIQWDTTINVRRISCKIPIHLIRF
jgi:hypothetical protein